jgi:hypothetical protein
MQCSFGRVPARLVLQTRPPTLLLRSSTPILSACRVGSGPGLYTPGQISVLQFQHRRFGTHQSLANDAQQRAQNLNQKGVDQAESQIEDAIGQEKEKQARTPWHREGSDVPPVKRLRSAGAMTKGMEI